MKKILVIIMMLIMIISINSAYATVINLPDNFALITSGNLSISGSGFINGNAAVKTGQVNLTQTDNSNKIIGTLYSAVAPTIIASNQINQINNKVVDQNFKYNYSYFNSFNIPIINNVKSDIVFDWYPVPTSIQNDILCNKITVNSTMTVDVSQHDIVIRTKSLVLNGGSKLVLNGSHKCFIFIDESLTGSGNINTDGISDNLHLIITKSGANYVGGYCAKANFYINNGDITIGHGAVIYGNISTGGTAITITGNAKITGVVYAPNASVNINGSGKIIGRLITGRNVDITGGSSQITYQNCIFNIPEYLIPTPTNTPTVTKMPTPTNIPTCTNTPIPTLTNTPIPTNTPTNVPVSIEINVYVQNWVVPGDLFELIITERYTNKVIPLSEFDINTYYYDKTNNKYDDTKQSTTIKFNGEYLVACKNGDAVLEIISKTNKYKISSPILIHSRTDIY